MFASIIRRKPFARSRKEDVVKALIPGSIARVAGLVALTGASVLGQSDKPTNDLPNPYNSIENYFKLPAGREWGSTSAVEIDKDGKSIWIAERCGGNSCLDRATGEMSKSDPILHYDASGKLMNSFGAGMIIFPHGIFVDRDGNVWVTDGQDNAPAARGGGRGRGAEGAPAGGAAAVGAAGAGGAAAGGQAPARGTPQGRSAPLPGATKGHQVFKFSPDGKLLMTLGKPGGGGGEEFFYQPNDILVAPNGEIYVSEGHASAPGSNGRILKFDKSGKLIKTYGKFGSGPGEFDQPHALAMDSRGRLFVGDRNNNRVQIFDKDMNFVAEWKQFSRPSGLFIDKNDNLYSADSESGSVSRNHYGWQRGMRVGSAKDGKMKYFIPDPETRTNQDTPPFNGTSAAEGVAVDKDGNIYGAEVGPKRVMKYTMKTGTR
jgi:DNA-binding beta-propeller fold protein YncE